MSYDMGWQPETQPKGKPPLEKTKGAETMQRLIDANALISSVLKKAIDDAFLNGNTDMHRLLIQVIAHQPTIDAEPVRHGKWIKADSQQYFRKHYPAFTCSECGQRKDSQKTWNYCPNCGADMRGEE